MAHTDTVLQKGHSSYQKNHLTKMAPNINDTSQKWHLEPFGQSKTIWHIPNIKNSKFKFKKCQVFPKPLSFFI